MRYEVYVGDVSGAAPDKFRGYIYAPAFCDGNVVAKKVKRKFSLPLGIKWVAKATPYRIGGLIGRVTRPVIVH